MRADRVPPPSRPQTTLTSSGIAKLAGVGRAAVSNWRRRHADFPLPVGGTPASPMFDSAEVEQWLMRQGKRSQSATDELAWRQIESVNPGTRVGDALCVAGAYLLSGGHDTRRRSPQQLAQSLRSRDNRLGDLLEPMLPPTWSPQWEHILHSLDALSDENGPEAAFEYLHDRYVTSARSLTGPDATPDPVVSIMLGLAGPGKKIFDFSCGTGSILRMAADDAVNSGKTLKCFAQEVKPQHALTTLLRLWFVHDRAARLGVPFEPPSLAVGDSLLADGFPDLQADMVVANPPFGIHDWGYEQLAYDRRWVYGLPPRTEPELAWVQHALSHLAPGRTSVLLMPPAAATRPAGRRIRGELIRQGVLQAVIALPPGMLQPTGIGLHLWVLVKPSSDLTAARPLLLLDTTAATAAEQSGTAPSQLIARIWEAYQAGKDSPADVGAYSILRAIDVLDNTVDLTPRRYLPQSNRSSRDPSSTLERLRRFDVMIKEISQSLPPVEADTTGRLAKAPTVSISDLIRSGHLSIHRSVARTRVAEQLAERKVLTPTDVITGGAPSGTVSLTPSQDGFQVKAGDILIPVIARDIVARVATIEQTGAELGPGIHAVRVNPELLDPWFLAGIISRTDNAHLAGRGSSASTGMLRIDIRRLTVPVLPIDVQKEFGNTFHRLVAFQSSLARVVEDGNNLAREIADGLAAGVLHSAQRRQKGQKRTN